MQPTCLIYQKTRYITYPRAHKCTLMCMQTWLPESSVRLFICLPVEKRSEEKRREEFSSYCRPGVCVYWLQSSEDICGPHLVSHTRHTECCCYHKPTENVCLGGWGLNGMGARLSPCSPAVAGEVNWQHLAVCKPNRPSMHPLPSTTPRSFSSIFSASSPLLWVLLPPALT